MKKEFWAHQFIVFFVAPLFMILSIICLIFGIVMTAIKGLDFSPLIFIGVFLISLCIYAIFFDKKTLCKIIFSKEEIILKRLNKTITIMKWSDIIDVKGYPYSNKGAYYMSFISKNDQIEFEPTKKMYDTIIELCPSPNLKYKINNIEYFKWFHRNKKS